MPPTRWKYWVRGCSQAFEGTLQVAWLHFADYDPHSAIFGSYLSTGLRPLLPAPCCEIASTSTILAYRHLTQSHAAILRMN